MSDTELPDALAVINPKRHDCSYPEKNLAGVGVAQAGASALRRSGRSHWIPAFVKVAAIGTLADVVLLTGENRVIAKLGLGMLSKGTAQDRVARPPRRSAVLRARKLTAITSASCWRPV